MREPTNYDSGIGEPLACKHAFGQAGRHLDSMLKCCAWNWRIEGVAAGVCVEAGKRHLDKRFNAEDDPDTGVHHSGPCRGSFR